jgi:hypothetical protein
MCVHNKMPHNICNNIFLHPPKKGISYHLFNRIIIVQVKYITIETKEVARIGYNGFVFPHEYSCEDRGAKCRVSYSYLSLERISDLASIKPYLICRLYKCRIIISDNFDHYPHIKHFKMKTCMFC